MPIEIISLKGLKGLKIRWHQRDVDFSRDKFRIKFPEAEKT
jgi:hypothetical protein